MSDFLDAVEKLQKIEAAISAQEKAVRQHPEFPSAVSALQSLRKRQRMLEEEFAALSHAEAIDICSYRIFVDGSNDKPALPALAGILGHFQVLFSLVYGALKSGERKMREVFSAEVANETSFGFGYSFPGSVGFVLTLPNERLLLGETDLDRTIETVFSMMKSGNTAQLSEFARNLGPAPIRAMYKLVSDHVKSGTGADLDWRRENEIRSSLFVQLDDLQRLQQSIDAISDIDSSTIPIRGLLVGADTSSLRFHFEYGEGYHQSIRGKISEDVIRAHPTLTINKEYTATFKIETVISYSVDEEKVTYELLSIET